MPAHGIADVTGGVPVMKAAMLCIVLVTGCASRGAKQPGYVLGGSVFAAGALVMLTNVDKDCGDSVQYTCDLGNRFKAGLGAIGMLVGAGILALTVAIPTADDEAWRQVGPPPVAATPEPPVAPVAAPAIEVKDLPIIEPVTEDPMLRQLTIQAEVAARLGRCFTVEAIANRVDELDRVYRAGEFTRDPVIAACLR